MSRPTGSLDTREQETPCPSSRSASVLPIPDRQHVGLTTYDAKDPDTVVPADRAAAPAGGRAERARGPDRRRGLRLRRAPSAARARRRPSSAWRRTGCKYNRFHTTALCSPTRQALLTGRNHHAVGMGGITEIATSAPGYSSVRPNTAAPLAETLKLNGYSTAQFGKCHEVPVWETSPMGPFDALADRRRRLRALLRLHRRRDEPVRTRRSTRARSRSSPTGRRRRATTSPRT